MVSRVPHTEHSRRHLTTYWAAYRISYTEKITTLIAGSSTSTRGYRDSSLLNSLFNFPKELIFIQNNNLLIIADWGNHKLRLLHLDKVTTLNLCNSCVSLDRPNSIMLTNDSLYVGQWYKILKFKCKF